VKLTVIADQNGEIISTARQLREGDSAAGGGGPVAGPDQTVYELDLPDELNQIADADEFHARVKGYVRPGQ